MRIQILEIDIVFGRLHPELPIEQSHEFDLQLIEFLEVDPPDVGYEVVAEEYVVEKLRSDEHRSQYEPKKRSV